MVLGFELNASQFLYKICNLSYDPSPFGFHYFSNATLHFCRLALDGNPSDLCFLIVGISGLHYHVQLQDAS
jgi:hypothetical protein